jgi:phosphonate transport system substrate-binding protein
MIYTTRHGAPHLLLVLALLCLSCSTTPAEPERIRIAAIPTEDAREQLLHLQPLADYLSAQLGVPVEFLVTTDYNASIEALRAGQVEMAWLGPFSYVLASDLVELTPIVGGIRKSTGDVFYRSIILARRDTGIETVQDLRGHTFAFVDPASTSGYLVPLAMLLENGLDPEQDFAQVVYAGSHTAVELAVANGRVDAAADSQPSYELMVSSGSVDPDQLRILWVSEPIPPSPLVARTSLEKGTIDRIRQALVDAGPEVISFEGEISGYAPVRDEDYDTVRQIALQVGIGGE